METKSNIPRATSEEFWAGMKELRKSSAEFLASLKEFRETDRVLGDKIAETDRVLGDKIAETDRVLGNKIAETDRVLGNKIAETDRVLSEKFAETDRVLSEMMAENSRQIKELQNTIGGMSNNQGYFAEEYFFNSFANKQQDFFGEKFDDIKKNIKGIEKEDEYDILLLNGKSVGIVEIKYKAHEKDIPKVLRKAETFRENFSKYAGHRVYLGLASMSFYPELEQQCIENGIAIIKQMGDTVVINDGHLKAY